MKPRRQNVTISRRVTRSTTTLERNSLPLPDELVFEIYSRLPLKSIARCRCVCKLWSSILRRQDFTELFLTKSRARPQLLFVFKNNREIVFFSSPQPENPEDNSYVVASNRLARFPGRKYFCNSGFSCYGFNLMLDREGKMDQMVLCNPSTGQYLNLPRLKLPSKTSFVFTYNGYDPVGKNFKVLSVVCWRASNGLISVEHKVVTLGGGKRLTWRKVDCCIQHHPCYESICINGVLYYLAESTTSSPVDSLVVCFDLRTEKFAVINFIPGSTTMVNYSGKLGLLMSEDSRYVYGSSKSTELWIAGENEWSKHVYVLPPSWKDVVTEIMCIAGMVGANEIVLAPRYQHVPSYLIYFNVERKTISKVGIQGMEVFQGKSFNTYLNYVENVELV